VRDLTVVRACRGEPAAVRQLVRTHQAAVHALVCRMLVGDPASVDDVCQLSLIKAIRHLDRFDADRRSSVRSWMLTIATRTAIDHLRRPRRAVPTAPDTIDALSTSAVSPEGRVMDAHEVARVHRMMAALPDDQRAALVLRAYHDLDYEEIAGALQVEVGTVKSRIARARASLRASMQKCGTSEVTHV